LQNLRRINEDSLKNIIELVELSGTNEGISERINKLCTLSKNKNSEIYRQA